MREVVPAIRAQQGGHDGVLEDARRRLGEDPVARERAQDAVQRVRVGARVARELLDAARAAGQGVCESEVGRERERARHERAAQRVPKDGLRSTRAHARAAATAVATSSGVPAATPSGPPARPSGNTPRLNGSNTTANIRHTVRHGRPTAGSSTDTDHPSRACRKYPKEERAGAGPALLLLVCMKEGGMSSAVCGCESNWGGRSPAVSAWIIDGCRRGHP